MINGHEIYENPEQQLICSIFQQAVQDIWLHPHNPDSSLDFFLNEDRCYGSFLWCCEILNIESGAILKQLRKRITKCLHIITHTPKIRRTRVNMAKLMNLMEKEN
jgi:hypothetical protein